MKLSEVIDILLRTIKYSIIMIRLVDISITYISNKDLQNNTSDTYFFAYKIESNYSMTKQGV